MIMKKLSDLFMAKTKNISKKPISKVYDMIRWIKNTVISFLHTQPGVLVQDPSDGQLVHINRDEVHDGTRLFTFCFQTMNQRKGRLYNIYQFDK